MPDFTLADLLAAQAGAPGPVYEGGPTGNVTPADVLAATGRMGARAIDQFAIQPAKSAITAADYYSKTGDVYPLVHETTQTGLGLAGVGMPFAEKGAAGVFGGRLAKTADLDKLATAEGMAGKGAAPEDIWTQTGWFQGPEGKWRFEIPDVGTGFRPQAEPLMAQGKQMLLEHAYAHPDLYAAYPQLRSYLMRFEDPIKKEGYITRGGLDPTNRELYLNPEAFTSESMRKQPAGAEAGLAGMRSTGLHELQHAVQSEEGFAKGGSPYLPEVQQATDQVMQERSKVFDNQLEGLYAQRDAYVKSQVDAGRPDSRTMLAQEWWKANPEAVKEAAQINIQIDRMRVDRLNEMQRQYRKVGGEVEARNVQARADMPADVLKDLPPSYTQDTPFNQQLIRMGDALGLDTAPKPAPYDFLTGRRPDAPYPQFAERYPDIGPPTMVPRDKGPGLRPEKTLTPEAEGVAAAREKIIQQMREEGYRPFFDPSQRFPAEFEKQPGPHVDTAGAVAKKQETIERHLETIGAPETLARLRAGYSRGLDLPDSQAWYLMGQVERKMIQDMGEEAGRKHFRDTFATAMSATTTGMNPQQNLIMAQYLNYLKKTGQPFPTEAHQTPVAVGGQRTMPNVEAYQKIFDEGGYEALGLKNPKRTDFAQALMGNPNAYTIDEQMAHAMLGEDVPKGGTYGLVTKVGREEAARSGVDPARHQDVSWAGFKKMLEEQGRAKKGWRPYGPEEGYQGKPMVADVNDMIERIHRLVGTPRQEIWDRLFIKNEIPVYGAAGLTLGGALQGQMEPAPR